MNCTICDFIHPDALRLYLINSPVVRADVLKFQEEGAQFVCLSVCHCHSDLTRSDILNALQSVDLTV